MRRDQSVHARSGHRPNALSGIKPIIGARLSADTQAELAVSAVHTRYGGGSLDTCADPVLLPLPVKWQVVCEPSANNPLCPESTACPVEFLHALLFSGWHVQEFLLHLLARLGFAGHLGGQCTTP